jgi:hypothetical protein
MAIRVAHAVTSVNPYPWISVEPRQTLIKSWTSLDKGAPPANMSRILPPKRILIFRKTIVSRMGVASPFLIASNLKLRNNSWLFLYRWLDLGIRYFYYYLQISEGKCCLPSCKMYYDNLQLYLECLEHVLAFPRND